MVPPLQDRLTNLVTQIQKLTVKLFPNKLLGIGYITIFAQNKSDYDSLRSVLSTYGNESEANNGYKYTLHKKLKIKDTDLEVVRIRKPDIHRTELGCCDLTFNASDYEYYRAKALEIGLDIVLRKEYEMIELSTFDLPVYAYIVNITK